MISHVVRRGTTALGPAIDIVKRAAKEGPEIDIPAWGIFVFTSTVVASFIFIIAVEYSLEYVITALTMVETPSAAITVSPSDEEEAEQKKGLLQEETGPTITLVRQKPITSSIRATLRHLVQHAGTYSRWRGFKLYLLHAWCFTFLNGALQAMTPRVPGRMILVSAITGATLANLHATWTHKIISMPTQKSFRERLVPLSSWKRLAFPAAVNASAVYVGAYICQGFYLLSGLNRVNDSDFPTYSAGDWASLFFRFLGVLIGTLLCTLFFVIPARVTLIRVEASLLPEDQNTIVPFDRTFGGKVVLTAFGGSGAVGFVDAWKSFNWEARWRVIKTYIKIFFIIVGMLMFVAHVLALELFVIMGPSLGEFLARAKAQGYISN